MQPTTRQIKEWFDKSSQAKGINEMDIPDRSPTTRAIVAAFNDRYELCGPFDDNWQELCLAAAFRAASNQLTTAKAIDRLRAVATELEGRQD